MSRPAKFKHNERPKNLTDDGRRVMWQNVSGSTDLKKKNPQTFQCLNNSLQFHENKFEGKITTDLPRTFPKLSALTCPDGQAALKQVLMAYAQVDPEVGYCQGMNCLAGFLLLFLLPEEAFWLFLQIMKGPKYDLRSLFLPGLPKLNTSLYLLDNLLPLFLPSLNSHFLKHEFKSNSYSTQWFLTIFTYEVNIDLSKVIWDFYLEKGHSFLFSTSLSILSSNQAELLSLNDPEEMISILKKYVLSISNNQISDLITLAGSYFHVDPDVLSDLEEKYHQHRSQKQQQQ